MGRISQMITSTQFYFYGRSRFTQTGWLKASKGYADDLETYDLAGKVYAVTGANSGVGRTTAEYLARRGARVFMVCRSAERAEKARQEMMAEVTTGSLDVVVGDVSLASSVRAVASKLKRDAARLDGLVCNAGALLNEKAMTTEGVETTFAAHLAFGCALLTRELLPLLKATAGSRVVYTSSGGMYNSKFPGVAACVDPEIYDGQFAYVYAKRGQVLLAEHYAKKEPKVAFVSSHPGWVRTAAVEAAYGDTAKYLEPMRTPWQGAEGQCWLCAVDQAKLEPGAFYLDRAVRRKHLAGPFFTDGSATKNTPAEVGQMVLDLDALADSKLEKVAA